MEVTAYKKKFKKKKIIKITTKFLGLIQFGYYGIKSMSSGILNHKQVENIRRIYVKVSKKIGKLFIRIFFQHPLTTKPLLSRMGKGVGSIKIWISYIKKGIVFLELTGINKKTAIKIFNKIYHRLPFKTKFITREVFNYKNI